MKDTIEMLRHALACIWTELEKDNPNIFLCQRVADEALTLSVMYAKPKDLTKQEVGVDAWLS